MGKSLNPEWYGLNYPTQEDLEALAWDLGASVVMGAVPTAAYFPPIDNLPAVIALPWDLPPLALAWALAHELGHLVQHSGPKGELFWAKNETQANRWAACALIPEARVQAYHNASIDAFVGALSAHFEELPLMNCTPRRLAGRIAKIRLKAMEENNGDKDLLPMPIRG